ncbi:MAG: rhomboid family intramembrane serine protease [Crocinitomicaceae bacterium]|nr:rhomboid family intramembrane serine protease [Crocinitomicaceae bacterium]
MRKVQHGFGSAIEAVVYPTLLLIVMWLVFWADHLFPEIPFYKWGVMPKTPETLMGIIFMPLLHSKMEFQHILNNSMPTVVLLGAIIYYYREIALKVFVISWLLTGVGLWLFAANNNSYHIGMSGVIYAMVGFLFMSGVLRKYKPLQSISLFVAFVYGSLIWGVFPIEAKVSWEGHLSGLVTGVLLAIVFRKKGPQSPKYLYEIEREMGIEPPDFEGQLNERIRLAKLREEERERERLGFKIVYDYVPSKVDTKKTIEKPSDETEP